MPLPRQHSMVVLPLTNVAQLAGAFLPERFVGQSEADFTDGMGGQFSSISQPDVGSAVWIVPMSDSPEEVS